MESSFQHDFANVRVHADQQSEDFASNLGAKAFTIGSNIYFGRDRYRPETGDGFRLLAHELAHVAQADERQAARAADAAARGSRAKITPSGEAPPLQAAFLTGTESKDPLANVGQAQGNKSWKVVSDQTVQIAPTPVSPTPNVTPRRSGRIPALEDIPMLGESRTSKAAGPAKKDASAETLPSINPPPKELVPVPSSTQAAQTTQTPTTEPKKSTPDEQKKATPVKPPQAKPPEGKPETDDKSGLGVQAGRGVQVTPGTAQPVVNYVQVTVQWKDAYLIPLKTLPAWLKGLSFLGEPSLQFQLHLDQPTSGTVDTQALLNLGQASFEVFKHKLDVSYVAGAMLNDVKNFKLSQAGKQVSPIVGGLDVEYDVARIVPHVNMSIDAQSLLPLTYREATPSRPGGREAQPQASFELRITLELP
jgi:hypothetical protein